MLQTNEQTTTTPPAASFPSQFEEEPYLFPQSAHVPFSQPPDCNHDQEFPDCDAEPETVAKPPTPEPRTKIDTVYNDLESLPFPEAEIKAVLGGPATEWVEHLRESLQLPFESVLLSLVS